MKGSSFNLRKADSTQKDKKLQRALHESLGARNARNGFNAFAANSSQKKQLNATMEHRQRDADSQFSKDIKTTGFREMSTNKPDIKASKQALKTNTNNPMILKSLHSPPKNPSSAVKYLYPSSVKHSTKPSTTSSSLMKQHAYNSTLSYSKERGKLSVSNLKAFQSISNKHSANNSKASAVANPVGVESNPKSEQSHSSAANSSVYASKRAKRISDLNNSADSIQNSSHAKATAQAKLSNNNENIQNLIIEC